MVIIVVVRVNPPRSLTFLAKYFLHRLLATSHCGLRDGTIKYDWVVGAAHVGIFIVRTYPTAQLEVYFLMQ